MANTQISALPEYSGNPTGGYSVFNNSGQTTTYKIKTQNLFGNTNTIGSAAKYPFVVGSGNTLNNILNVAIGYGNTMTGGINRDSGLNAAMVIGNANSITDTYTSNYLVVGQNNTNAGWNSLVVGQSNSVPFGLNGIVVGQSNISSVEFSSVFGHSNTATSQGGFTIGSSNINQGYAIAYENQFICGLSNQTIMAKNTAILGGTINQINGVMYDTPARPHYDAIIGGNNNTIGTYITGSTIVGSSYSSISGTSATTINSNIIGGKTNTIKASSYSSILGGSGNTVSSGSTNVQMIGCSGRTSTMSSATFVENLVVFNYSNLDYADDTAAAAGGVVLGQVYHNAGALRIRIV